MSGDRGSVSGVLVCWSLDLDLTLDRSLSFSFPLDRFGLCLLTSTFNTSLPGQLRIVFGCAVCMYVCMYVSMKLTNKVVKRGLTDSAIADMCSDGRKTLCSIVFETAYQSLLMLLCACCFSCNAVIVAWCSNCEHCLAL